MHSDAVVVVNVVNVNDESPIFEQQMYTATVTENAEPGTPLVTVAARDLDTGEFGRVTYKLEGTHENDFSIGADDGVVRVVNSGLLDREVIDNIILQVCDMPYLLYISLHLCVHLSIYLSIYLSVLSVYVLSIFP